jgi:hypothetical protein
MLGGGGLIALYGVACLLACAIIGLSRVIPAWLAALLVGAALLTVAGGRRSWVRPDWGALCRQCPKKR